MDEKIIFKEESYKIIGICMNIHSTLGNGFLEAVYCEVLEKEFVKNNIPYKREVKLDLFFNGEKLDKKYKADFICFDNIILEIKAVSFIHENFTKQTLNYLKATDKKLGLLINFGEKSLKYKRIINL
ncbi:GxxExxY protein [Cloacibacterium normanense]|uniref:GxxExxY family protein n=1 Tax=Cloacibacterium normanense TaxID=237258 RepID=A0A1E5UBZ8_9FLAO|nr:GxxExxY protein [Cloacibacterium normanense]AZI70803.1 GxxExxY protein [Cloacibacterium normanense]OEL10463.1 gxxExxY family protein [Cloacibacterium normanense]SDO50497.1 GxxExxY protein [Cloacibacterium normanense]